MDQRPSETLRRSALWIWAIIGALVLSGIIMWMAGRVRIIWLPLVFAAGLVVLLDPIVNWMERGRIPRVAGIAITYLLTAGLLVAFGFLVVPPVRAQFDQFVSQLPNLYDTTVAWLQNLGDTLGIDLGPVWTSQTIQEWIQDPANQASIQELLGGFGSGAGRVLRGVTETVAVVILAPVLAFYLLHEAPRIRRRSILLVPQSLRSEVAYVGGNVAHAMTAFVRGQFLVAAVVGIMSSFALWLIDIPFWLIIGLLSGFLNLIPLVGPFVGGALAALVALLSANPGKAVLAIVALTIVQQIDNHLITPLVQKSRVQLSPLIIVIALLIGGSIAGFLGVLVAVPTVAALRIVVGHIWRTRVLGESWEEATDAMIERRPPPERLVPRRRRPPVQENRLFDTAELDPDPPSPPGSPTTEPVGDRPPG